MTLELFDGAKVRLRNGDERTIKATSYTGSQFVWHSPDEDGNFSWTKNGQFRLGTWTEHPHDIVDIIADKAPETDSFTTLPYSEGLTPEPDMQYILRNGQTVDGLLFFEDEIHTEKRDTVWTRIDGKCRVPPLKAIVDLQDRTEEGMRKMMREHDIVRVAFPAVNQNPVNSLADQHFDLMIDRGQSDKPHDPDQNVTMNPLIIEQKKKGIKLTWDAPVGDDAISHFEVYRSGDDTKHRIDEDGYMWVTPPNVPIGNWHQTKVPRRRLLKTMIAVAEGLGGKFGAWEWGSDASSIRFSVLFTNSKRSGGYVGYEKWVTLTLTDDENNAMLPMRDRK